MVCEMALRSTARQSLSPGGGVTALPRFVWDRVPAETLGEGDKSYRGMMVPLVQAGVASGLFATDTGPHNDADDIDRLC
jgi:hypothetical protein